MFKRLSLTFLWGWLILGLAPYALAGGATTRSAIAGGTGDASANSTLKVVITNQAELVASGTKGTLAVGIFTDPAQWLKTEPLESDSMGKKIDLTKLPEHFEFSLPQGVYAVAVRVDENGNDKMDYNFFGAPTEPFGFSNNPDTFFEPSFEDCSFSLSAPRTIHITIEGF